MKNIVGFLLRFIQICKRKFEDRTKDKNLTVEENLNSEICIVKYLQKKQKLIDNINLLITLTPFVDSEGLVRVGGRLHNSKLSFDTKHPILLPKDPITIMFMTQIHLDNYHAGPQTLLMICRQRFWPIHGKRFANKILHNCVRCARTKPQNISQLMGNLPESRVIPLAPFSHCGIDFAGPFLCLCS